MIVSRDRILTTHVGSLPRNEKLSDLLVRREAGEQLDATEFAAEMDKAVRHVVDKQVAAGIDIGNDGEQQRVGFQTYVPQRMSGFAGVSKRRRGREFEEFPELVATLARRFPHTSKQQNAPEAQSEIKYLDLAPIESELGRFKRIAAESAKFSETFMTAPSLKQIDKSIYDILAPIRHKAGLYIADPELTRLNAFIIGFQCGLALGGMTFRDEPPDFFGFHDWVARRLGYTSSTMGWYKMIRGRCASEREAFDRFYELLDEFRSSGGTFAA